MYKYEMESTFTYESTHNVLKQRGLDGWKLVAVVHNEQDDVFLYNLFWEKSIKEFLES